MTHGAKMVGHFLNEGLKHIKLSRSKVLHNAPMGAFCKPLLRSLFFLFEWLLKTGFTVLTTYMYFVFCGVRRLAVR